MSIVLLIKQVGSPFVSEQRRYSPATIIGAKQYQNSSTSEPGQICTSHVERSNLTVRMQNRRFTRLTNAFSKKWENHELMFALFVAWYNFARHQMTLETTPAVAAGLAREPWTTERLLRESAKAINARKRERDMIGELPSNWQTRLALYIVGVLVFAFALYLYF